jgi:hypothetical protein
MEIERLSFVVTPEDRVEDFVNADEEVWGPWLRQQKGYLRKAATVYPGGRVDLRLFWDSKKNLRKAAESPEIPALEVKLRAQFLGVFNRLP